MNNIDPPMFVLQERLYGAHERINKSMLRNIDVSVTEDFLYNELIVRLETYVLSHKLDEQNQTCVRWVPATWWHHFKQDAIKWGNPFFNPDKVKLKRIVLFTQFQPWLTFPEPEVFLPTQMGKVYVDLTAWNEISMDEEI